MNKKFLASALSLALLSGCASVPMASKTESDKAKQFNAPTQGKAGLYIYRSGGLGGALKKDVFVNNKCVGETAPNVFFYQEVDGNQQHKVSTESEFSQNDLFLSTDAGKNYFIQQYIKMGLFVGGADLKVVNEDQGKNAVQSLELAKKGVCSN